MKIALIGGAGARAPLLVQGLGDSGLPLEEVALYDIDQERLGLIGGLAQNMAPGLRVTLHEKVETCVAGAQFVFVSIRVGGIEGRARDERVVLRHGIAGQETVGPGGFAMAVRTIPEMLEIVSQVARHAPDSWIINFTNPVSIITQAVQKAARYRIIGICDTPTELFEEVAFVLGVASRECHFDFFGLNHLGWLRQVLHRGVPILDSIWENRQRLEAVYRAPLFEVDRLQDLRLLPTEYLYYYYRPDRALSNLKRAGSSRGEVIARLNSRLMADLRRPGVDQAGAYRSYLASRDAGYMEVETGAERRPAGSTGVLTGYDRIAMAVVSGIHFNTGAIIPLNVRNQGNFPFLEDDDVIEVPCLVNQNGALPLSVPPVPSQVEELIVEVKEYERLTITAARERNRESCLEALSANPLVADLQIANHLLTDLGVP
jgi:6-phospho-beta-glucosidase